MKILVFDTETNDKAKDFKLNARDDLNNYPYILQIAARLLEVNIDEDLCLHNKDRSITIKEYCSFNSLVQPDRNYQRIMLSQEAFNIHGITLSDCLEKGNTISEVLCMMQGMMMFADIIICHNVNFDKNVLVSEALRLGLDLRFKAGSIVYCTMLNTVEICKIPSEGKAKFYSLYKWPKLEELYKFLTGNNMEDNFQAHDAMGDVNCTVDCVIELLRRDINLFSKNIIT